MFIRKENKCRGPLYSENGSLKKSQANNLLLVVSVVILAGLIFQIVGFSVKIVVIAFAFVAFGISFVNAELALIFLIFSMLLSPELIMGEAGRREVMIRADDVFLGVVILGWFARMALDKDLALFKGTPLNGPIAGYIAMCLISTLYSAVLGRLSFLTGFFFTLKYIEYFLLFFMVVNVIQSKVQIKRFVYMMFFVFVLISIYAWLQRASGIQRVSTPFEGQSGEANTLGGYLVFMIMLALGILFNIREKYTRFFLGVSVCLALPALMFTLSRGSWIAFIPAATVLFVLSRKGKLMMTVLLLFTFCFAAWIFPREVKERFAYTFEEQVEYDFLGKRITLDESAAARIEAWVLGIDRWKRSPVIGHGVGSPGPIVDNQYTRTLTETGTIGFILFSVIILRLLGVTYYVIRKREEDDFYHGLACGFYAGIVGLLFHSLSAASFIIIRIIEPFWFVAAIIVALPRILQEEEKQTDAGTSA